MGAKRKKKTCHGRFYKMIHRGFVWEEEEDRSHRREDFTDCESLPLCNPTYVSTISIGCWRIDISSDQSSTPTGSNHRLKPWSPEATNSSAASGSIVIKHLVGVGACSADPSPPTSEARIINRHSMEQRFNRS